MFVPLLGRHTAANALAAIAVGKRFRMSDEEIARGLATAKGPEMRLELQDVGGVTLLNDAYNANPASMAAALRTLATSRGRRRLAVLGEMRELGTEAARAHRELGTTAAAANLDALFLLGEHAEEVRAGAEAAGMPADRIIVTHSHDDLAARLGAQCRPGDLVLLKGSRGAAMEEVLRRLETERMP